MIGRSPSAVSCDLSSAKLGTEMLSRYLRLQGSGYVCSMSMKKILWMNPSVEHSLEVENGIS